jgi:hypothetical protein
VGPDQLQDARTQLPNQPPASEPATLAGHQAQRALAPVRLVQPLDLANAHAKNFRCFALDQPPLVDAAHQRHAVELLQTMLRSAEDTLEA